MSSEILSQSSETALDQTIENSKKETVALWQEVVNNAERGNHPDPIRYFSNWHELTPEVKDEFERVIDTRLESLLDEANQKREELQVTPITKLYFAEWVMELHLINPEKKTDIILFNQSTDGMTRSDQWIVSPELYAFLNSNEDALKRYLTDKVEYIREKKTPKVMPRDFSIEQGAEIVDSWKVKNALKMLQNLVFILRQIEWDSYFGGDKKLVWLKQLLEDAEAWCLYSNELSKRKVDALIEQVYPVFDQFIKEEESWTQYGEFSEESIFKDKKGNFRKLFYVDEQKQREIIRSFAGTKANFLQRYLEDDNFSVEDQEANQVIQNIEKLFTIEEGDVNENGEVINPEKKKAFDDLFTAENPWELGSLLKTLWIDIPTFKKEDLGWQMELLEKLHTELQTIKTKLEPNNLPSKDSLKEDFQNQKEALERKNPKTFMEECMLVRLEQILADEKQLNALYEEQKQQYIFELKYHAPLSLMRSVFYPTLAEYGKGATGPNGEMYNDMIGYWFWDISDEHRDIASEMIKETLITVTAWIMTAWIGLGMTSGTMALAASTNSLRIGKIARTLYQWYSRAQRAKLVKIWLKWGGCILEGTMFNANMDLLHAVVNGESLDGLNLNPVDTENLRTAVMIAFLKCSHSMKPANWKYLDIEGKLSTINPMINPVIDLWIDITSLVTAEEVNNVVFWKDVIIDGKIITERGITKIEGAEVAQMIGLILMNKLCYGTIFQEALKKKAFKIEKINNQYRTILENQAWEPIEQILDKIPKQCQYKFLTKEGKLFYQREDGSLVQTLSYKDAMWFLNTENKELGKPETNNDVQELPPSQQQLTNGWQRSHKYSGDRDPFDEVIENQMKKAEAADDQRPDIGNIRDLTDEKLKNTNGWWTRRPLWDDNDEFSWEDEPERPNENQRDQEGENNEDLRDDIPDKEFVDKLMAAIYPKWWLEMQPWIERTLKTIKDFQETMKEILWDIDEIMWDETIQNRDLGEYADMLEKFPTYKEDIKQLQKTLEIKKWNISDEELLDIYENIQDIEKDVFDFQNHLYDLVAQDYPDFFDEENFEKMLEAARNDPQAQRIKEFLKAEEQRIQTRKEERGKITDPTDWEIFDWETEHRDYKEQEKHEYGTTREDKIWTIKEILSEEYDLWAQECQYLENIKESKLNLLMVILDHPSLAEKFFDQLKGEWTELFNENFKKFVNTESLRQLQNMLWLDATSAELFLHCFNSDCFKILNAKLEDIDLYRLAIDVKDIYKKNPNNTALKIKEILSKRIIEGKYNSWETFDKICWEPWLRVSPEQMKTFLQKMGTEWMGNTWVNVEKYRNLIEYEKDIDYLQTVLKGKKYTNKDLDILLNFTSQQRNFIHTLGKTDNYNALNDFLQAPGKGLQVSVETIANLDMKDFAKSLWITEGTNLLETCFEYDMYAVLKQSQKPIEYAELAQYINEFATTYPQHISHSIFFKKWFKRKLSKN